MKTDYEKHHYSQAMRLEYRSDWIYRKPERAEVWQDCQFSGLENWLDEVAIQWEWNHRREIRLGVTLSRCRNGKYFHVEICWFRNSGRHNGKQFSMQSFLYRSRQHGKIYTSKNIWKSWYRQHPCIWTVIDSSLTGVWSWIKGMILRCKNETVILFLFYSIYLKCFLCHDIFLLS